MKGGITLQIKLASEFDPAKFERCKFLKFSVIDSGIGMHEKRSLNCLNYLGWSIGIEAISIQEEQALDYQFLKNSRKLRRKDQLKF